MNAARDAIAFNARLVYFMGPSGAGKDSLMQWLAQHPPPGQRLHVARRIVTRPAPDDEATDPTTFERLRDKGALAMHWSANGWHYGVRREHLEPLYQGSWVLVSGSRAHWSTAQGLYPGLTGVYVHAPTEVLLQRIRARGRETDDEVRARIERAAALPEPEGVVRVCNDGELGNAGARLVAVLASLAEEAAETPRVHRQP